MASKARPSRKTAKATPARKEAAKKKVAGKKSGAETRGVGGVRDRVSEIQKLIDVMVAAGAVEVELAEKDSKIRVRLKEDPVPVTYAAAPIMPVPAGAAPAVPAPEDADAVDEHPEGTEIFKSPMVGTFYLAPAPDADPFCKEGDQVEEDGTLCIIEAMKVMNEIKAERPLQVVRILAENGEPVEYDQPLFLVKV